MQEIWWRSCWWWYYSRWYWWTVYGIVIWSCLTIYYI
jgi:hypothetical protein